MAQWQEVAEGGALDLINLGQYESELDEGSSNLLQLILRLPVTQGVATDLENILREAGVEDVRVTTGSPILNIYFKKGFPWLAIIAAIILASLVVAALVITWKLFTMIPTAAIPFLLLAGIAAVTVVGIYLIRETKSPAGS